MYFERQPNAASGESIIRATFSQSLVGRYQNLTRNRIHSTAKTLRTDALGEVVHPTCSSIHSLEPDEALLLPLLDFDDPVMTLQLSRQVSDVAISKVLAWNCSFLEKAAHVGALVEREWWELPDGKGGMIQNVALSRASGRYFTPPDVAWHISVATLGPYLDEASTKSDPNDIIAAAQMTVLDPACGAGIFLACALEILGDFYQYCVDRRPELAEALGTRSKYLARVIERQLYGIEISERVCGVAFTLLANALGGVTLTPSGLCKGDGLELSQGERVLPREFDAVLLNPPFGRLRFQESEIRLKSRALRPQFATGKDVALLKKAQVAEIAAVARKLPRFKIARGGVLDWQRLFLAQAINKTKSSGRFGAIVPISLMADRSAVAMRSHLLQECQIERVDLFAETAKLFPGVNQPTCVVVATKSNRNESFPVRGPSRSVLALEAIGCYVNTAVFKAISPSNVPIVALSEYDIGILTQLRSFKRIGEHPKIANRRGELDLTLSKELLRDRGMPLVRGSDIERFRSKTESERERIEAVDFSAFERKFKNSKKLADTRQFRIAGRQCAFLEKPRRMSFAVINPENLLANSCNYLIWEDNQAHWAQYALCGILNSSLFEWRFRLASSNNHVNNYEIDDLPAPNEISPDIADVSMRLSAMLENLPFGNSALPTSSLEAELDALVFREFGLTASQAEHVLRSINASHSAEVLRFMK